MDIALFLGGIFLFTFLLGILLEKIRIPWIFAALFLGLGLAFWNPFAPITESEIFRFLSHLGMYFLLFLIGFSLDFGMIRKLKGFIVKSTFFIIFLEAFFGTLLLRFIFEDQIVPEQIWFVAFLIALSFATVGEAVLIPILEEFKLTKTKLGQSILGIGTFDDVIEVFVLILIICLLPLLIGRGYGGMGFKLGTILIILFSLGALGIFTFGLIKLKKRISRMIYFPKIEAIFLLVLAIFFLFLGIGNLSQEALVALGALLSGLVIRNILPQVKLKTIEPQIKATTFGLFGPIFFLWVGIDTDINYLIKFPLLIVLVIVVAKSAKILGSFLIGRKELGNRGSVVMGIALGVRFSTSIVIIKLLYESGIILGGLYSVLIGSSIAFKFIIPFLLSYLIPRWKLAPE